MTIDKIDAFHKKPPDQGMRREKQNEKDRTKEK